MDRADEFLDRIEDTLPTLIQNLGMGGKRKELLAGLQRFPVGSYGVFHQQIVNGIDVIRVLHGSRDVEELFRQG